MNPCNPIKYQQKLQEIKLLAAELAARIKPINDPIPVLHRGPAYESAALTLAETANKLQKEYRPRIDVLAADIANLHGKGWDKEPAIVQLWVELAKGLSLFSHHPVEKVAALIVSPNGALQSWGVNRIPEGQPLRGEFLVTKIRKNYIVCAERNAVFGSGATDLSSSTMVATALPCAVCRPILPKGLKIITDTKAGATFTRSGSESLDHALKYLNERRIEVIHYPALFQTGGLSYS